MATGTCAYIIICIKIYAISRQILNSVYPGGLIIGCCFLGFKGGWTYISWGRGGLISL